MSDLEPIIDGIGGRKPRDEINKCFEKVNGLVGSVNSAHISFQQLGIADGDDATTAINNAVSSGYLGVFSEVNINIDLSAPLIVSNASFCFDFTGTTITQNSSNGIINFDGGHGVVKNITNIDSATRTITTDVSDLLVGDIVKIISDDRLEGNRPISGTAEARQGMYATISDVNVSDVTINEKVRFSFATNPRLVKLNKSNKLIVKGGEYNFDSSVTGKHSVAYVTNAVQPEFVSNTVGESPFIGVNLIGCYKPTVIDLNVTNLDFSVNTSHGVSIWSSAQASVKNLRANKCRHSYTTNQEQIEAGSTNIAFYGDTYDLTIDSPVADGDFIAALDTHHGCDGVKVINASVQSSSAGAVGVRGRNVIYDNLTINNSVSGLLIYSEIGLSSLDYSNGVTVNNPVINVDEDPIRVQRVLDVKIHNAVLTTSELRAVTLVDSEVEFHNLTINATGNSDNFQSLFFLDNSKLSLFGETTINSNSHSGVSSRLFSFSGSACELFIERITLNGGTDFPDTLFNNVDAVSANVLCENIVASTTPASVTAFSGAFEGESRFSGSGGDLNTSSVFNTVTNNEVITLNNSNDMNYNVRCNPSSGNITLDGIESSFKAGQEVLLININNTNTMTVPSTVGAGSADIENFGDVDNIIQPKASAPYRWIDNKWFQTGQ